MADIEGVELPAVPRVRTASVRFEESSTEPLRRERTFSHAVVPPARAAAGTKGDGIDMDGDEDSPRARASSSFAFRPSQQRPSRVTRQPTRSFSEQPLDQGSSSPRLSQTSPRASQTLQRQRISTLTVEPEQRRSVHCSRSLTQPTLACDGPSQHDFGIAHTMPEGPQTLQRQRMSTRRSTLTEEEAHARELAQQRTLPSAWGTALDWQGSTAEGPRTAATDREARRSRTATTDFGKLMSAFRGS